MQANSRITAEPGDVVVIHGHATGDPGRTGVILDVLGAAGHEHYRVRWDEEHESLFWPGPDATVRPGARRQRRAHCSVLVVRETPESLGVETGVADGVPDAER